MLKQLENALLNFVMNWTELFYFFANKFLALFGVSLNSTWQGDVAKKAREKKKSHWSEKKIQPAVKMMERVNAIVVVILFVTICDVSVGVKFRKSHSLNAQPNDVLRTWNEYYTNEKEKNSLKHFAFSATDITRCKVGDTECIVETSNKVLNVFSTGKMNLFVFSHNFSNYFRDILPTKRQISLKHWIVCDLFCRSQWN